MILWILISAVCICTVSDEYIFANAQLNVTLKDDTMIFENETITTDMFAFELGNESICDLENIKINPYSFSEAGEHSVTFTYKENEAVYVKKVMVNVQSVEALFLYGKEDTVQLIQGQKVTKEQLPEIFLHYNNGEQKQIEDYTFMVDWEKKKVYVCYEHFHLELAIDVIENKMDYLEITPYVNEVPENHMFAETDIMVTLHYTNGTKENVTDYQIMPYKLEEGCESFIYVTYEGMTGNFKVKATKEVEEMSILPTASPIMQPMEGDFLNSQPTTDMEDETQTDISKELSTSEPQYTNMPKESEADDVNGDYKQVDATSKLAQEEDFKVDKKDTTPPKTKIKEKTYKKDLRIYATDESGIASIVLRGSINKTIKNGYKLTKEGSYQLILTDIYGNKKTIKFKLEKPVKKIKVSYAFTDKWNVIKFLAKATGTSRAVKWSVSDKKVAAIDKNGMFKAKKSGTVYLIAKLDKKKIKQKIKIEKKKKSILLY